jgi:hypothetical protein
VVYYNLQYQNNAKILLEWVYFHMMQGVGHFYFYYFQLTTAQNGDRARRRQRRRRLDSNSIHFDPALLTRELAEVPDLSQSVGGRVLLQLEAKGVATLLHWEQSRACDSSTIALRWGTKRGEYRYVDAHTTPTPDCNLVDDVQVLLIDCTRLHPY